MFNGRVGYATMLSMFCGKSVCGGCVHSSIMTGNYPKCPFCYSDRDSKSDEEQREDIIMKRVVANDAASIYLLANDYYQGLGGLQEDSDRAKELLTRAADLGARMREV